MTADKDLSLKLDQARWWALREQPFYGQLAMGLVDSIDTSTPTACTDGRSIRWGREFLAGLTEKETRFVLLHETLHCAHGHLWRLPPDAPGNEAADYCINDTLGAVAGMRMPEGGLAMPAHFRGMAEEEIYAALAAQRQEQEVGQLGSACGDFTAPAEDDQPGDGPGDGASSAPDSLRDQWERRVVQASQAAQATAKGSAPADLARILDRIAAQPINWREELVDFVKSSSSTRNDWSRPARRHAWQRVIYPRRRADDIGLVIFARDTSGSIGARLCAEFSALISQCLAETGCRGLVLDCDADIQDEIEMAPGDDCPLTAKGGGGTSHLPIFARAAELVEQGERIAGLVCLTDLDTDFPPDDGGIATLWIATSFAPAPFGRIVRVRG